MLLSRSLYAPVKESPSSDHLITLEFSSSLRILHKTSIPMRGDGASGNHALVQLLKECWYDLPSLFAQLRGRTTGRSGERDLIVSRHSCRIIDERDSR